MDKFSPGEAALSSADPELKNGLVWANQLEAHIDAFSGTRLIPGNSVELLIDGPNTFAAIFASIQRATHHIHVEAYIFGDGMIGSQLGELLVNKAKDGVEVRVICDTLGCRDTDDSFFDSLRDAGIELLQFRNYDVADGGSVDKLIRRNHRKLVVIDGKEFYTGGINFCEKYIHGSREIKHHDGDPVEDGWRDTHVRITGPATHAAQKSFVNHWNDVSESSPANFGPEYYPPVPPSGEHGVRVLAIEGNDRDSSLIRDTYIAALRAAKHSILLTHAYFVPDDELLDEIRAATEREVTVKILLPGVLDSEGVRHASRALFTSLLEAGVQLFETRNTVLHAKTAVVDGCWSTVGSCNLDFLSLY